MSEIINTLPEYKWGSAESMRHPDFGRAVAILSTQFEKCFPDKPYDQRMELLHAVNTAHASVLALEILSEEDTPDNREYVITFMAGLFHDIGKGEISGNSNPLFAHPRVGAIEFSYRVASQLIDQEFFGHKITEEDIDIITGMICYHDYADPFVNKMKIEKNYSPSYSSPPNQLQRILMIGDFLAQYSPYGLLSPEEFIQIREHLRSPYDGHGLEIHEGDEKYALPAPWSKLLKNLELNVHLDRGGNVYTAIQEFINRINTFRANDIIYDSKFDNMFDQMQTQLCHLLQIPNISAENLKDLFEPAKLQLQNVAKDHGIIINGNGHNGGYRGH
jgi:hypothetical protein